MNYNFFVPKKIQKKRKFLEGKILDEIQLEKKRNKSFKIIQKTKLKKIEDYIKDNFKKKNLILLENRIAKKNDKFILSDKSKVIFAIRIRGINGVSPKAKKILELLRLNQINNGVFLKLNNATSQMLKKIEPYIAYGYPSLKNIKNLIEKRGYGKIGKRGRWQRIFLSGDQIIDHGLKKIGISTLKQIINEISTCGPKFKEVNNFLWPFQLKSPKKGYANIGKTKHFIEGGAYGNWEDSINSLIKKMN
jgi:large subunit ribosomal protein L7e